MTEPFTVTTFGTPIAQEFMVTVTWVVPNKNAGKAHRTKTHNIAALSILEACSLVLERHRANIVTEVYIR